MNKLAQVRYRYFKTPALVGSTCLHCAQTVKIGPAERLCVLQHAEPQMSSTVLFTKDFEYLVVMLRMA